MNEQSMPLGPVFVLLLPLLGFVVTLLILRLAAKMKWLTAIAVSLITTSALSVFSIRCLRGHHGGGPDNLLLILLPVVAGVLMLMIKLFQWLASESAGGSVNAAERTRILGLVEAGKISTEEGTDLLNAMGRSSALQGQDKFSRLDISMLIGVALVILGFFLPWANLGNRLYQVGHQRGPIGWAVLIVAALSVVPIFVTPRELLYKISMLQIFLILVGLALVIKELSVGADQLGTIFCLAGFIVAFLGSLVKLKSLAA